MEPELPLEPSNALELRKHAEYDEHATEPGQYVKHAKHAELDDGFQPDAVKHEPLDDAKHVEPHVLATKPDGHALDEPVQLF